MPFLEVSLEEIHKKLIGIYNDMKDDIKQLKIKMLKMSYKSQEGHLGSSFSIIDILYVLYNGVLNIDKDNTKDENRDRFILSKAHASLALSVILQSKKFITQKDLDEFCTFNGKLGGHLSKKVKGIEFSGGSLGHGLTYSVGIAKALKIKGNNDSRVYCLIGDCELQEGSNWEAMLLAGHHKLDNLVLIIDNNKSHNKSPHVDNMDSKMKSFGFEVEIIDGHNLSQLRHSLIKRSNNPRCIICNTIKGKGIKSIEGDFSWHHRSPKNQDELNQLIQELEKYYEK